jgi:DNA-binding NtrC family response regulator
MTLEEMERKMIADSLKRNGNNISVAAVRLGITRQTLYNKMKSYGLLGR